MRLVESAHVGVRACVCQERQGASRVLQALKRKFHLNGV